MFRTLILAAVAALAGGAASAATITYAKGECDAGNYVSFTTQVLNCGTSAARREISNVNLGAGDGNFYSLGLDSEPGNVFGGIAIFELSEYFTGPAVSVEVTNTPSTHWEAAAVYVGNTLTELQGKWANNVWAGIVDNGKGGTQAANTTVNFGGSYRYLMFEDVSYYVYGNAGAGNMSQDGFDLDSFSVAPVPLPAGGLLLVTAFGALGLARRRKR